MSPKLLLAIAAIALLAFGGWLATRTGPSPDAPVAASPSRGSTPPTPTLVLPQGAKKRPGSPVEVPPDPALQQALADPDPKIRLGAIETVIRDGDDPAAILAASLDRDEVVSVRAMEALGKLYTDGRITLADLTARHGDRDLSEKSRRLALEAIAQVASPAGARYLADLAARGSIDDRRTVAMLLATQHAADAVPVLRELARDGDETVRMYANAGLVRHRAAP